MGLLRIFPAIAFSLATLALSTPSFAVEGDDYSPIEASSVSEQTIVPQQISRELNRPIQVGVFVGVSSIFVRQKNEELHITASRNKLRIKQKGKRQQTIAQQIVL